MPIPPPPTRRPPGAVCRLNMPTSPSTTSDTVSSDEAGYVFRRIHYEPGWLPRRERTGQQSLDPQPPAASPIPVTVPPPPPLPGAGRAEAAAVIPAGATPEALEDNASSMMRILRTGIAIAEFAGFEYGPDCLSLRIGDRIEVQIKSDLYNGWAYGARSRCDTLEHVAGWFPSNYVRTAGVGMACCDWSPVDYGRGCFSVARGDWLVLTNRIDRRWAFGTKIPDGPADAVQMALRAGPYGCIPMAIWLPVARLNPRKASASRSTYTPDHLMHNELTAQNVE